SPPRAPCVKSVIKQSSNGECFVHEMGTAGGNRRPSDHLTWRGAGSGARDPGLPFGLVRIHPDLAGLVVRLAAVDRRCHRVLVVVGPAEVLDKRPGSPARVAELLAGDLVQDVVGIVA